MKNLFFALLIVFTTMSFAQEEKDSLKIKITSEGIIPLVVKAEGVTAQQMYDRTKLQITKMFKNPDYVIKADQPGKLLRFSGYENYKGGLSTEGKYFYTCELEFKDGRYKISFYDVYRNTGFQSPATCFNKAGEIRSMSAYKTLLANFIDLTNKVLFVYNHAITAPESSDGW